MTVALPGEPGSPLLSAAGGPDERFEDADGLARRIHQLRRGAGLDCTPGHASIDGGEIFPGVMIWRAEAPGRARRFLAFAAGPGVRTPGQLLAALRRAAAPRPAVA